MKEKKRKNVVNYLYYYKSMIVKYSDNDNFC